MGHACERPTPEQNENTGGGGRGRGEGPDVETELSPAPRLRLLPTSHLTRLSPIRVSEYPASGIRHPASGSTVCSGQDRGLRGQPRGSGTSAGSTIAGSTIRWKSPGPWTSPGKRRVWVRMGAMVGRDTAEELVGAQRDVPVFAAGGSAGAQGRPAITMRPSRVSPRSPGCWRGSSCRRSSGVRRSPWSRSR